MPPLTVDWTVFISPLLFLLFYIAGKRWLFLPYASLLQRREREREDLARQLKVLEQEIQEMEEEIKRGETAFYGELASVREELVSRVRKEGEIYLQKVKEELENDLRVFEEELKKEMEQDLVSLKESLPEITHFVLEKWGVLPSS